MSRNVVPSIVFVTLTIMFGSSFLVQRHDFGLRTGAGEKSQLAVRDTRSEAKVKTASQVGLYADGRGSDRGVVAPNAANQAPPSK